MKNLTILVFLVLPFISLFGQDTSTTSTPHSTSETIRSTNDVIPTGNNWVDYRITVENPTVISKIQFIALVSTGYSETALPDLDVYFEINGKLLILTEELPSAKATDLLANNIGKYELLLPKDKIMIPAGINLVRVSFYPKKLLPTNNFDYVCSVKSKETEFNNNLVFGYNQLVSNR